MFSLFWWSAACNDGSKMTAMWAGIEAYWLIPVHVKRSFLFIATRLFIFYQ
jgi:hypothetical protein